MNDDLRVELEYCLEKLGLNDLDMNNLTIPLRELEETSFSIEDHLLHISDLLNEFMTLNIENEQMLRLTEKILVTSQMMREQLDKGQAPNSDASRKLNTIMGRNHEVFMSLSSLIAGHN